MECSTFISSETLTAAEESRYVSQYLPLVKRVVKQLAWQAQSVIDSEDMQQIALMGLLSSLRRYGRPDEQFGAFAAHRIRGAILDELRVLDWRPRRLRQKVHKLNDAIRELSRRLGKEVDFEEIKQHLAITSEEYQEYLLLDSASALHSLDELLTTDTDFSFNSRNLEDEIIISDSLRAALAGLDEREQLILSLYYQHEMSLKEIALVLDLTEARICQLNKKITQKIKDAIEQ
ncbi:FliA/WhiG family RNA polymerase sigma factor [Buttiauxella warmboldiae]|uniref:FliA/WhiG family RNA polymerase sigma factor n=1 Tax=Buttiauxella warmboldiae TaxID=82993 RepID=A0A3N5DQE9_9ENTR|nr:FliA/WhiG family RNA polymerase sigma factor [Buttiauxella warmboldiae]RPH29431.1 FliA/WhiG family RNA polymerase sigma factor [Buttiauxella warmboldiae]